MNNSTCPSCGSEEVEYIDVSYCDDKETIHEYMKCYSCNTKFTNIYTLTSQRLSIV